MPHEHIAASFDAERLSSFVATALQAAGSAPEQAGDVARALTQASLRGVDSHGVRLLPHYAKVLKGGRIAAAPRLAIRRTAPAAAVVDADNGFGHWASYHAIREGCAIARETGMAGVSVINSSHFGAAGCYVLEAAKEGLVAFAFSNSDSFVLPHDGVAPFHGTNPIAFAAPVPDGRPFLFDMATSIVPWNRIRDYETKGLQVPPDVAVDDAGQMTTDPSVVNALLPVGGVRFGFKGAGLAGVMEVLSAVMTGMAHCARLIDMTGSDISTPRRLGHFFVVINPDVFVSRTEFDRGMTDYLTDLRANPSQEGKKVMAPGDREWAVEDHRSAHGIPVHRNLLEEFNKLIHELKLDPAILECTS